MNAPDAAADESACSLQLHQLRGIANERFAVLHELPFDVSEAMKPVLAWMTSSPSPETLPELALERLMMATAISPSRISGEALNGHRSCHAPMDLVASCLLFANSGALRTRRDRRTYLDAIIARYDWCVSLSSPIKRSKFLQALCKLDDALGLTGGRKADRPRHKPSKARRSIFFSF